MYDVGCGDGRVLIQLASASIPLPSSSDDGTDHGGINNHSTNDTTAQSDAQQQSQQQQINQCQQHQSYANNNNNNNNQHRPNHQHHCHTFIGIEISPERTLEAQTNIQLARKSKLIPDHVSIEIRCMNALEVNYANATVCFLYLVPRGLRLIKPLLWPGDEGIVIIDEEAVANNNNGKSKGGEEEAEEGENGNDGELGDKASAATIIDVEQSYSLQTQTSPPTPKSSGNSPEVFHNSTQTIGEPQPYLQSTQNQNSAAQSPPNLKRNKPRRIITYMSGFENEQYVQKECCRVEHQEGALWPVYLYHVGA